MQTRRNFLRKAFTTGTVIWSGLRLPPVVQDRKPRKRLPAPRKPASLEPYPWTY